jgi:dihydrofolate reductase
MRKLIVNEYQSLDGVVQGPSGPGEDQSGGFSLGGWTVLHWDAALDELMARFLAQPFDLLLGRGTFELFAARFPFKTDDPLAQAFAKATKYVVTHRPLTTTWAGTVAITGDAIDAIKQLKAQGGPEIQVHGSPGLGQTLQENNLVDEYRIWTFPVLLGHGKRLFEGAALPVTLKLEGTSSTAKGVVVSTYSIVGGVSTAAVPVAPMLEPDPELRET